MELVQLLESSTLLVPEWHELKPYPAAPAPQAAWRTDVLTTLQVGPVDLLAGDVLDVRLEHEFDAERQDGGPLPGASAYTVNGEQSEHWFLYVMASTSARLRAGGLVVATDVLRTKETNWDNLIHHLAVCRAAFWRVPQDSALVFTSKTGLRLSQATMSGYWAQVKARAGLDFDFYHASKHYGVHYLWTKRNLSRRAIAAQAGWKLGRVDEMLAVYGHGDVGALEEIDRAFEDKVVPIQDASKMQARSGDAS